MSALGAVTKTLLPPVFTHNPVVLPSARERSSYTADLSSFALSPEHLPLSFAKVSGPSWVQVSAAGTVFGTPARADLGAVSMVVGVTDPNGLKAWARVQWEVLPGADAIEWISDHIVAPDASINVPYRISLSSFVTNPPTEPLTFSTFSAPSWVVLNPVSGVLSGVPAVQDKGVNTFIVRVSIPSGRSADATVSLNVN